MARGTAWNLRGAWHLRGTRDTKSQVIEVSVSSLYYLFSVMKGLRLKRRSSAYIFQVDVSLTICSCLVIVARCNL